jgi:hypothetical protein
MEKPDLLSEGSSAYTCKSTLRVQHRHSFVIGCMYMLLDVEAFKPTLWIFQLIGAIDRLIKMSRAYACDSVLNSAPVLSTDEAYVLKEATQKPANAAQETHMSSGQMLALVAACVCLCAHLLAA